MTPFAAAVAILPGSRPHEVRTPARADARRLRARARRPRERRRARPRRAQPRRARRARGCASVCATRRVRDVRRRPARWARCACCRAFDVALCASGTASLEAALARAVPVVAYRVGLATELTARALRPHAARRAAERAARAARVPGAPAARRPRRPARRARSPDALDRRRALLAACDEVEALLGGTGRAVRRTSRACSSPWLGVSARAA